MAKSVYIHIPFCKSKCNYCSFVSYDKLPQVNAYIAALISQIENEYKNEPLETLYIGGGTPSLLSVKQLSEIVDKFNFAISPEITIEVNPNDISLDYLKALLEIGINRLSIGIQTFDDEILKVISRRHDSVGAKIAIECAINSGFKNISLDFIYGLPNQNLEQFLSDLRTAMTFAIQHVSLYGLKIDNNCYFEKYPPENLPDEDMQADMYLAAVEFIEKCGFQHYEVSNFSKVGFNSKHNTNYWNAENYYGFGCSASGYVNDTRYTNLSDLEEYIKNPLCKSVSNQLTQKDKLEETIFLGLRKCSGINVEYINKKFDIDFEKKYSKILDTYAKYINKTPEGFALNLDGFLISNLILSEFIDV